MTQLFKKASLVITMIAIAATMVISPVRADTLPGEFEITTGTLNLKFIKQTTYDGRPATFSFSGLTADTKIFLYTNGSIAVDGNTKPSASTTDVQVRGNTVVGFSNGSGKGFASDIKITNFSQGSLILPLCGQLTCTLSRTSFQANSAEASNSTDYTGQTVSNITELTTASSVTSLTNLTATGESDAKAFVSFPNGSGNGEYYKKTQVNYLIPAFSQTGIYISTLTVTGTVNP